MKKRNLVVANWKMNPDTLEESKTIFNSTRRTAQSLKNTDVVVCAPFPFLQPLSKLTRPKNIFLGVQNISSQPKGALTGEVSAGMVRDSGAKYVIVGHSERRAMGEGNDLIKKKMEMAFNNKLTPILCIGEKERDRDGSHLEVIKTQIKESLFGLQKKDLIGLLVAYEPIWAIGRSYKESMSATDIHETTLFIKKAAGEVFGKDVADSFVMLYGGSVEAENSLEIMRIGGVSGFLVGHASLASEQFSAILKSADTKK